MEAEEIMHIVLLSFAGCCLVAMVFYYTILLCNNITDECKKNITCENMQKEKKTMKNKDIIAQLKKQQNMIERLQDERDILKERTDYLLLNTECKPSISLGVYTNVDGICINCIDVIYDNGNKIQTIQIPLKENKKLLYQEISYFDKGQIIVKVIYKNMGIPRGWEDVYYKIDKNTNEYMQIPKPMCMDYPKNYQSPYYD